MQLLEHYSSEFAKMRQLLPRPEVRDAALQRLRQQGFPTPRDEAWRDTNIRSLLDTGFAAAPRPSQAVLSAAAARLRELPEVLPDSARLVLVNGWYVAEMSEAGEMPDGVTATAGCDPEDAGKSAFALLGDLFAGDGLRLVVRGEVRRPLHLLYVNAAVPGPDAPPPLLFCPKVSVTVEPGASVTIVESHVASAAANSFSNCTLRLDMEAGSKVSHVCTQWDQGSRNQLQFMRARQQSGSALSTVAVSSGADCARRQTDVELCGERSSCQIRGLYVLGAKRQMDFRTKVTHASANSGSEQLVLGLLKDKARSMFHGHLVVNKDAQQVQAHQKNENLVLAEGATAGSQPMLEIRADDVKCSHGAAIGNLDKEALFALRARSLDEAAARHVLTEAFYNRVLEAVDIEPLRLGIRDHIAMDAS